MKINDKRFDRSLNKIFQFLSENHKINRDIQISGINHVIPDEMPIEGRVIRLLRSIYKTQSRPNLDAAKEFFEWIEKEKHNLNSYKNFKTSLINKNREHNSQTIYEALRACGGWGEKTSALFLKNLLLIKHSPRLNSKFWSDLNLDGEKVFLPVDAVIREIFFKLTDEKMNFKSINKLLHNRGYDNNQMIIWDDLWFWGFITQSSKIKGEHRGIAWNPAKYWAIEESKKDVDSIKHIIKLAKTFIGLIDKK